MADVSPKLIQISRIMASLSLVGALLYLLLDAGAFLAPDSMKATGLFEAHHLGRGISSTVPFVDRLYAFAFDLIPAGLVLWALIELHRLFQSYMRGAVFTEAALRSLSRIAGLMFLQVLAAFLAEAPISYLLSLHNSPGHREISLSLTSHDVSYLFMAGVVLVIARVMAEARRVADENASFV